MQEIETSMLSGKKMIQDLDEKDNQTIFKVIETFLTKKKFKDFFNGDIMGLYNKNSTLKLERGFTPLLIWH